MKQQLTLLLLPLFLRTVSSSTIIFFNETNTTTSSSPKQPECQLYLAPSSLSPQKLGVYSSIPLESNSILPYRDVIIPILDLKFHNGIFDEEDEFVKPLRLRDGIETGSQYESRHGVHSATPGILFFQNHSKLGNVKIGLPSQDSATLYRHRGDAGIGAFSYYHDVKIMVVESIEAGSELFSIENDGSSTPSVFDHADEIVKQFHTLAKSEPMQQTNALWDYIRNVVVSDDELKKLLPSDPSQLFLASQEGTARFSLPDSIRSLEWLHQHGHCMDNLRPGVSTIPQAGRGAFAARVLPEGIVITTSPVLKFQRSLLDMYDSIMEQEGDVVTRSDVVVGEQLWINYCFGTPKSKYVLFPLGGMVNLINHSSQSPNVEIRWKKNSNSEIIMEYIATKDIQPDEEIFVNYGTEWEEAWDHHVKTFVTPPMSQNYKPAFQFNQEEVVIRTIQEQQQGHPYPGHIKTCCYYSYTQIKHFYKNEEQEAIVDFTANDIFEYESWSNLNATRISKSSVRWMLPITNPHWYLRPCRIFNRYRDEEGEDRYVAIMMNFDKLPPEEQIPDVDVVAHVVMDIPREGIQFVEDFYSSDVHFREGFRHVIGILEEEIGLELEE